jgi:hypothetical protein
LSTAPVPADLPPTSPHDRTTRDVSHADAFYHYVYLVLAIVVLFLSRTLEVSDQHRVVVPVFGVTLPESCTFQRITGAGCPGCGLTRCFICLAHGRVPQAWSYNPGGLFFFAVVVAQIPYRLMLVYRIHRHRDRFQLTRLANVVVCSLAAVLVGQWVWRAIF